MEEKNPGLASYETSELADILRHYKNFTDIEIENVYRELKNRDELKAVIEQLKKEVNDGKMDIDSHKNPIESVEKFNADDPIVMVLGSDQQLVFEQMIVDEAIPCYRHERSLVFNPNTMVYFHFRNEDRKRVNDIQKEAEKYVTSIESEGRTEGLKKSSNSYSTLFIWALFVLLLLLAGVLWIRF